MTHYQPGIPVEHDLMQKICRKLQKRIGPRPTVELYPLHVQGQPRNIILTARVQPRTLSEISRTIRAARNLKLYVRGMGGCTGGDYRIYGTHATVLIDTTKLEAHPRMELTRYAEDHRAQALRVLASVTMEEFIEFQIANHVEVYQNCDTTSKHSTVVGAIAACVPGSFGIAEMSGACLADEVLFMRVVDANGDLREISGSDNLKLVAGSMGLFGIVYDVFLRCHPLSVTKVEYEFQKWSDLFENSGRQAFWWLIEHSFITELYYLPFNSCGQEASDDEVSNWNGAEDEFLIRKGEFLGYTLNPSSRVDEVRDRQMVHVVDENFGPRVEEFVEDPCATPRLLSRAHANLRMRFLPDPVCLQFTPHALHAIGQMDRPVRSLKFTVELDPRLDALVEVMEFLFKFLGELGRGERTQQKNFSFNLGIRINFTPRPKHALLIGAGWRDDGNWPRAYYLVHFTVTGAAPPGPCQAWDDATRALVDDLMNSFPECVLNWKSEIPIQALFTQRYRELIGPELEILRQCLNRWDEDGIFTCPLLSQVISGSCVPDQIGYHLEHTNSVNEIYAEPCRPDVEQPDDESRPTVTY